MFFTLLNSVTGALWNKDITTPKNLWTYNAYFTVKRSVIFSVATNIVTLQFWDLKILKYFLSAPLKRWKSPIWGDSTCPRDTCLLHLEVRVLQEAIKHLFSSLVPGVGAVTVGTLYQAERSCVWCLRAQAKAMLFLVMHLRPEQAQFPFSSAGLCSKDKFRERNLESFESTLLCCFCFKHPCLCKK